MSKPLPPTYRPNLPLPSLYEPFAGKSQWVCHDIYKQPISARTGLVANCNEVGNQAPLAVASGAVGQGNCVGIGFAMMPFDTFSGIDLDLHKPDHDPAIDEFYKYARTFSERSPFGGIHLLCRLDNRFPFATRHLFNQKMTILKDHGYMTITGRVDRHEPVADLSDLLEKFLRAKVPNGMAPPVSIHQHDSTGVIDNRGVPEIMDALKRMTTWNVLNRKPIGVRHFFEDTPENRCAVMLNYGRWFYAECAVISAIGYVTADEQLFLRVFAQSWLDRRDDLRLGTNNLFGQDRNHKPHCWNDQIYLDTRLNLFHGSAKARLQQLADVGERMVALRASNPHLFEGDTPLSKWIGTGGTFTLPNDRKAS